MITYSTVRSGFHLKKSTSVPLSGGKKLAYKIYIVALILSFAPSEAGSQTTDFFTNTQGVDSLSTGASGACPTCPGFNPDFLIRHSGTDPDGAGPITFSMTITTTAPALPGTATIFFSRLGTGAITDNAFGFIADPGADPVICGTTVGLTAGGLNCGSLKFDPASQGFTPPTLPATDNLISNINDPKETSDHFPNSNDHTAFDLDNRFIWSRTTSTLTAENPTLGDLSVTCTAPNFACVASKEREYQVTLLVDGAAGTLATPGTGDQVFTLTNEWSTTGSSGTSFTPPTINWSLQFNDPIRDDVGNPRMQSNASGSFVANADTSFPDISISLFRNSTALCRGVAGTAGTCVVVP
ncbi:hypothetical protein JYT87_01940 [Nitrospira defluvii]|nr:hypothetical protein [Nitrospira defluvii]